MSRAGYISPDIFDKNQQASVHARSAVPVHVPEGHLTPADVKRILAAGKPARPIVCLRCSTLNDPKADVHRAPGPKPEKLFADLRVRGSGVVVVVADVCDMPGSLYPGLMQHFGSGKKIILAANKIDLFPPEISHKKITDWLRKVGAQAGYGYPWDDVRLISARTGQGVMELVECIMNARKADEDVWIVGCANVGKSALLNALRSTTDAEAPLVTTSLLPGTTINTIHIPLASLPIFAQFAPPPSPPTDSKSSPPPSTSDHLTEQPTPSLTGTLHDTPGLSNHHQLTTPLTLAELKYVIPSKPLIPRNFQLNPGQTLFLGGLAYLSVTDSTINVQVYASHRLPLHLESTFRVKEVIEAQWGGEVKREVKEGEANDPDTTDPKPPTKPKTKTPHKPPPKGLFPPLGGHDRTRNFPALTEALAVAVERGAGKRVEVGIAGVGWVGMEVVRDVKRDATVRFWSVGGLGVRKRLGVVPSGMGGGKVGKVREGEGWVLGRCFGGSEGSGEGY
ncbi:hypothetical protein HDV00_010310 [Rhizophlyctis rosea]|nr:hypothetical protein HDV00_010310 [Rhizophlyctis rosea]